MIKRYDDISAYGAYIGEDEHGRYVRLDDYKQLESTFMKFKVVSAIVYVSSLIWFYAHV